MPEYEIPLLFFLLGVFICSGHTRSIRLSQSSLSRKMVICDGKIVRMDEEQLNEWAIVPSTRAATLPYDLPDGWVIEEVPRTDGSSMVDKVRSHVLQ